jgi:hypothetical protein
MTVYRIIMWFERHWWALLLPIILAVGSFYLYAYYHGHDLRKLTFGFGTISLGVLAFVGIVALFAVFIVCLLDFFGRDR